MGINDGGTKEIQKISNSTKDIVRFRSTGDRFQDRKLREEWEKGLMGKVTVDEWEMQNN